ncbi:MAG: glycosyltransferase family 2 protein [Desulfobacterales bacterium]
MATLSIIAPAQNEEDNITGLIEDIDRVFQGRDIAFEVVAVDDGSTDKTLHHLGELAKRFDWLKVLTMTNRPPVKGDGKGAAYMAGFRHAAGEYVATIDADRQNDPGDLPALLEALKSHGADMVQGDRSGHRKDNFIRKISSKVGKAFRKMIIQDVVADTSCGIRIIRRDVALQLPLQYKGMHRFIGYYVNLMGYKVVELPVKHFSRVTGKAKYNIWNRMIPGLIDLFAVRWMTNRIQAISCMDIRERK